MMNWKVSLLIAAALLSWMTPVATHGEDWSDFSGTFVFTGDAPKPNRISVTKDVDVCGKHNLVDDSLVVNPDNKGIANIVVFMYLKRNEKPPVHESYAETATSEVTLDNLDCMFEPHVAILQTTQKLLIGNKDPVGHNTKIDCSANSSINPIVPANESRTEEFPEVERVPVPVSCNIHPWMKGWLLIKDNPYSAVTDKDGKFEIKHVPAGEWTFTFWHEGGYVENVKVGGKATKWKKGRNEIKFAGKPVDLGTVEVAASALK